jgi:DNA-binding GntR family transcriptional regulator
MNAFGGAGTARQLPGGGLYAGPMSVQANKAGRPSRSGHPKVSGQPKGVDAHLVATLVAAIHARIGNGEVPIGTWLRQERLAQELGVSRMPVREALRQLEALGVVEIIPNRGARVRLPSTLEVIEVFELRGVLEAHAGAAAAQLISSEQVEQLRHVTESFRHIIADLQNNKNRRNGAALTRSRWYEANGAFHSLIIEASGNRTLGELLKGLHLKIPQNLTWLGLNADIRRLERNAAEHEQIFAAINAGDVERTRELLLTHARHASEVLVRALGDGTPADG